MTVTRRGRANSGAAFLLPLPAKCGEREKKGIERESLLSKFKLFLTELGK